MKKLILLIMLLAIGIVALTQNNFKYPLTIETKALSGAKITAYDAAVVKLNDNIDLKTVLVELTDTLTSGAGNYVTPYQYKTTIGMSDFLYATQLMGSDLIALPVTPMPPVLYIQVTDNTAYGTSVYLPSRILVSGVHVAMGNSTGSFTADGAAFNGFSLYSTNGITATLVMQTINNASTTIGTGYEGKDIAFVTPTILPAGVYFIVLYYKTNGTQPSPPSFVQTGTVYQNHVRAYSRGATPTKAFLGFTKTGMGAIQGIITLSTVSSSNAPIFMALY